MNDDVTALIDQWLEQTIERELFSSGEVQNWLLDLRLALQEPVPV